MNINIKLPSSVNDNKQKAFALWTDITRILVKLEVALNKKLALTSLIISKNLTAFEQC